jgi:predicted DNA-binding transcriptional regulator AlpA
MTRTSDRWIQLGELAELFGLSEESIKRFAKKNGFPLRRLTPYAKPGVIESEFLRWLKAQPLVGRAVRGSRVSRSRNISVPKHRR